MINKEPSLPATTSQAPPRVLTIVEVATATLGGKSVYLLSVRGNEEDVVVVVVVSGKVIRWEEPRILIYRLPQSHSTKGITQQPEPILKGPISQKIAISHRRNKAPFSPTTRRYEAQLWLSITKNCMTLDAYLYAEEAKDERRRDVAYSTSSTSPPQNTLSELSSLFNSRGQDGGDGLTPISTVPAAVAASMPFSFSRKYRKASVSSACFTLKPCWLPPQLELENFENAASSSDLPWRIPCVLYSCIPAAASPRLIKTPTSNCRPLLFAKCILTLIGGSLNFRRCQEYSVRDNPIQSTVLHTDEERRERTTYNFHARYNSRSDRNSRTSVSHARTHFRGKSYTCKPGIARTHRETTTAPAPEQILARKLFAR
ncbi:hypothetical protein TSAR_009617, partial [Trichomalopsis sarcophagae]